MVINHSWPRFLHEIVVFARSATHIAESANNNCQKSAKSRQEPPRTIQINDDTDTPSNIHSPQLAKRSTARRGPNAGAALFTPHGFFQKYTNKWKVYKCKWGAPQKVALEIIHALIYICVRSQAMMTNQWRRWWWLLTEPTTNWSKRPVVTANRNDQSKRSIESIELAKMSRASGSLVLRGDELLLRRFLQTVNEYDENDDYDDEWWRTVRTDDKWCIHCPQTERRKHKIDRNLICELYIYIYDMVCNI